MAVLNQDFPRVEDSLADLKDDILEMTMLNRVPLIIKNMRLRAGRIVIGTQPSKLSIEFDDAIYDAFEKGIISDREYDRIIATDMIISAICRDSKSRAYVAVEASFVVDANDVARARRSAEILAKAFPSAETRSAAYGKFFNPAGRADAEKLGVSIIRAPRHPREAPR